MHVDIGSTLVLFKLKKICVFRGNNRDQKQMDNKQKPQKCCRIGLWLLASVRVSLSRQLCIEVIDLSYHQDVPGKTKLGSKIFVISSRVLSFCNVADVAYGWIMKLDRKDLETYLTGWLLSSVRHLRPVMIVLTKLKEPERCLRKMFSGRKTSQWASSSTECLPMYALAFYKHDLLTCSQMVSEVGSHFSSSQMKMEG